MSAGRGLPRIAPPPSGRCRTSANARLLVVDRHRRLRRHAPLASPAPISHGVLRRVAHSCRGPSLTTPSARAADRRAVPRTKSLRRARRPTAEHQGRHTAGERLRLLQCSPGLDGEGIEVIPRIPPPRLHRPGLRSMVSCSLLRTSRPCANPGPTWSSGRPAWRQKTRYHRHRTLGRIFRMKARPAPSTSRSDALRE